MEFVVDNILTMKRLDKQNIFWKAFMNKKFKKGKTIDIALLNAPCYGFGDVIFAQKLAKYLRKWYNANVKIFTTLPQHHINLGENQNNIVKPIDIKSTQCRTFTNINFGNISQEKFDLYIVAPIVANFSPDIHQITRKFSHANKYNVFFCSEYNASTPSNYMFPTGVGKGKCGIMLVDPPKMTKLPELKNPYAVVYIADSSHIPNAKGCYQGFIELICNKYHYRKIEVVVPDWIAFQIIEYNGKNLLDKIDRKIVVKTKDTEITIGDEEKTLIVRGDIYPVNNEKMFSLMKYSLKDILLTGDQSITDALSCCSNKNIFYQIAPWKESFGRELSKHLPNKFYKSKKTSCGTIKAINYNSNYKEFVKKWDFRKLARPKMDAIVNFVTELRENEELQELVKIVDSSRKLPTLKKKIRDMYF
jgi:hypothetical protein